MKTKATEHFLTGSVSNDAGGVASISSGVQDVGV